MNGDKKWPTASPTAQQVLDEMPQGVVTTDTRAAWRSLIVEALVAAAAWNHLSEFAQMWGESAVELYDDKEFWRLVKVLGLANNSAMEELMRGYSTQTSSLNTLAGLYLIKAHTLVATAIEDAIWNADLAA